MIFMSCKRQQVTLQRARGSILLRTVSKGSFR
jgi:hypothetical protein